MTTYDKASLVMIPSGYKDDKLYSIKPTDGSGDFTFSRDGAGASPATRVNASGLIEKGRTNEILQSNQFDTTWSPSASISVTGGQSGYDGSSDAWLLERSDTSARYINQNITLSSAVYSYSVYAKADSVDWMYMWSYNGTGSVSAYFDVANGIVGTTSGLIDANIEEVVGGWYRCSMSYNNNIAAVRLYPAVADGSTTGGVAPAGIFIQDAQLESGLIATSVIETTTTAVSAGLLGDMPRLDYSGGATCPSLLLEPSRVNQVDYSEYFNGSIWTQTGSSVTDNDAISPEGVQNAAKVVGDGSQSYILLNDNYTYPSTGNWTLSVFAKAGNNDFLRIQFGGVTGAESAYFDLVNGTTPQTAIASIEPVGTDGWYRCSVTANLTGPDLTGSYNFFVSYSDTTSTFPSAGDANGQYVYLYGAQLEAGSYPTSYIPTYGSASTRAIDSCSKTGISSLIGQTEGTLYFEGTSNVVGGSTNLINFNHATNSVVINRQSNKTIRGIISISGPDITFTSSVIDGTFKAAIAYKDGDSAFYVNGVQVGTSSTSFSFGTALSEIYLGAGINYFALSNQSAAKQALVFKTRLTNAELASLTTL